MATVKMSSRNAIEAFRGLAAPTFWKDIRAHNEGVTAMSGIPSFMEYALKAFFSSHENDSRFCVHYQPTSNRDEKRKSHILVQKNSYKGPPSGDSLWRTCGVIVGIDNGGLWIRDRSQIVPLKRCSYGHEHYSEKDQEGAPCRRITGCPGVIVIEEGYPTKKLIINMIHDITLSDNTRMDFSPFLRAAFGMTFDDLTARCREKSGAQKKRNKSHRMGQEKVNMKKIANETTNSYYDTVRVKLASLTPEDRKKIKDYWNYLSKDYANALIKDY